MNVKSNVKSICGVILASANPAGLAEFYSAAFGLSFEREDHGGLEEHFGTDIGEVHFGIHPPVNLHRESSGNASVSIAFNVDSFDEVRKRIRQLGAREMIAPHDEGFGMTTTFADPDGNHFEIVALTYRFGGDDE